MRFPCLLAFFLLVALRFAAHAAEPQFLYAVTNGKGPDQMAWIVEDGRVEPGHLQGPGAVLALSDDLRLFADTLNYRLVLRRADDGRALKIYDLSEARETGLKFKPLIIDLADCGNGVVYAADEANMVVWRIDLGPGWRGPKMKIDALVPLKGEVSQLSRISADRNGGLYVVDLPAQRTVSFDSRGAKKFAYEGLTNGVCDGSGLLYHPMYYGDARVRDVEMYDARGRMVGSHARLEFDRPICYIVPVGFDSEGTLYIFADSDEKGPLAVRIPAKGRKQVFTALKAQQNPGFSCPTPCWNGPAGSLEWAEYVGETVKIYRIGL